MLWYPMISLEVLALSRYSQLKSKYATFCWESYLHLYGFSIEIYGNKLEKSFELKCILWLKDQYLTSLGATIMKIKKFCSLALQHCIRMIIQGEPYSFSQTFPRKLQRCTLYYHSYTTTSQYPCLCTFYTTIPTYNFIFILVCYMYAHYTCILIFTLLITEAAYALLTFTPHACARGKVIGLYACPASQSA